jgi:hypothetical protein
MINKDRKLHSRRGFIVQAGALAGAATLGLRQLAKAESPPIQGFEKAAAGPNASKGWQPVSDRKIRVGIAGYGVCQFGGPSVSRTIRTLRSWP